MLFTAVTLLTLACAAGTLLGFVHLKEGGGRPPLVAGLAHAGIGAAGLAILLLVLRGPPRGLDTGVSTFGPIAAGLFFAALLLGALVLLRKRGGLLLAVHAGIAITAYVILLAWNALG